MLKAEKKSLLLNPYLYFGTEKDVVNSSTINGLGARLVGQLFLNKGVALQGGIDANDVESALKSDIYIGIAFAL